MSFGPWVQNNEEYKIPRSTIVLYYTLHQQVQVGTERSYVPPQNYLDPIKSLRPNKHVKIHFPYTKVTQIVIFKQALYGNLLPWHVLQCSCTCWKVRLSAR
jgi:hypothetical protein